MISQTEKFSCRVPSDGNIKNIVLPLLIAVMTFVSAPVYAQDGGLEEIVVTAQHRAESLQDVPIAVSAFSEDMIDKARIESVGDIVAQTPNFSYTPFSQVDPQLFIRGIGSSDDGAGGDPSVLVFQDDVVFARASGAALSLFDVERIEVLRGPQGTLYGKNAVGGAIRVVTKDPVDTFEAMYGLTVAGDHDRFETRGMINVPLNDRWQLRLASATTFSEGFNQSLTTGRPVDGEDNRSFRAKLRYAGESVDAVFSVNYTDDSPYGNTRKPLPAGTFALNGGTVSIDPDPRKRQASDDGYLDRTIVGTALNLDWDLSLGTLTSITAFRNVEIDWYQALAGLPTPPARLKTDNLWREETDQFSQELRWAGESDNDKWNWVLGGFFLSESVAREEEFRRSFCNPGGNVPTTTCSNSAPIFDQNNDVDSTALFAHVGFQATDSVRLTAGTRFSKDDKSIDLAVVDSLNGTGGSLAPALEEYSIHTGESWDEMTSMFAIDVNVSDDAMLYASISEGYKAGGFQTAPSTALAASVSYSPEFAESLEIGVKSEWFDNRLRTNLSWFQNDYEDLQVLQLVEAVPGDLSTLVLVTDNAADADISGIELELLFVPTEGLTLGATYATIDAEFSSYTTNTGADLSGFKLRRTPEDSYSIYGEYEFGVGSRGNLILRADYASKGAQFFENDNRPVSLEPSFSLLNASVRFVSTDESWNVTLWGKNLNDELYRVNSIAVADSGFTRIGPPRTWGLTFNAYFGE